jgi:hypothetical protein
MSEREGNEIVPAGDAPPPDVPRANPWGFQS